MSELSESLLNGRWQWILNIERYQNRHTIDALSVADHSWLTAMLSMMIFDSIGFYDGTSNDDLTNIMRGELLTRAILHDVEESLTGDIPLESETKVEIKYVKGLISNNIMKAIFPSEIADKYSAHHMFAKHSMTVEGSIVRYADMLSALIEALRENDLGNTNLDDIIENAMGYLRDMFTDVDCGNRTLLIKAINYMNDLTDEIINYIQSNYSIKARIVV